MPLPMHIKAPAKINLFLNLLGPRPDGFHDVRFVMQRLTLCDTLTLSPGEAGLTLTCSDARLSGGDNLVEKAYKGFYEANSIPPRALLADLEKVIPVQAGLGGGSSDAAAMLMALNALHSSPLSQTDLMTLGACLGSDVPFFMGASTAVATGRGEIITPVSALPACNVLLVKPRHWGIATPEAFGWVRGAGRYKAKDFSAWEGLLSQSAPVSAWASLLHNDFEAVVFPRYPQLAQAKQRLLDLGALGALLSGSGPTVFGLFSPDVPPHINLETAFPAAEWITLWTQFDTETHKNFLSGV